MSLAATTGGLFFLADEGQDEGAAVRRGAVLEQEDALPSAELQPSVGDGDAELGLGQRALDVGRHVVRPFVIVAVERDIFWHDAMQKSTEVAPHIGRCKELAARRDYPPLTPEVKNKIFGENAARIFGIDIAAARQAIKGDLLYKLRDDRNPPPPRARSRRSPPKSQGGPSASTSQSASSPSTSRTPPRRC